MVQKDQDEKFAGTYRKLFDTIERGVEQYSTDRLQTLLEEKKKYLKLGLEAFGEASSQSRSKVTSGSSVTVDGKTIKLEQKEKDLILKLSDIINLSEVQCVQLWEAYRQENKESVSRFNDSEQTLCENIELIMNVVNFYYEDRISLLQCIGSLQRIALDESHPYSTIAANTVDKLRDHNSSTPFPQRLFAQYSALVRSSVPNRTYSFPGWASVWAKQNLKEQKALLEIIFLFSFTKSFEPTFIFNIIQEFEADCFGVLQSFGYVLDDEGLKLREAVTNIATLLSVNLIVAPTLTTETNLSTSGTDLINTPDIIVKINQVALYLGGRSEHAPFLLAWSYFITCLDCMLSSDDVTVPDNYKQTQLVINGIQQAASASILISRPMVNGTEFEETRQLSIQQKPNMDRIFLGRSLKLNVFVVVTNILESEVCSEEDVNNFGYRSVLRNLFKGFLSTTRPYYIPIDSYATLIKAYCLIYKNQAPLCDAFWNDDFVKDDPYTLLATARGRFPVFFSDLTQLLSALSGGTNGNVDGKAAENVYEYLCHVPSITVELGDNVQITAAEENGRAVIHANQSIRVTQELQTISSIEIAEGSQGLLLSSSEEYSLVQFPLPYSGWHLLTAVLAGFMNPSGTGIDIKDEDGSLKGNNIGTVDSILDLLYNVLLNNPKLVTSLVQHIESAARIPGQSTGTPIIISVLCNILSSCSRVQPCPIPTMTLSLQCLTLLIPHYCDDIWAYLQTAPILPRPNANIPLSARLATSPFITNPGAQIQQIVSRVECTTGRYTLLLAFLDMVQGLVYDVQRNWWVNANEGSAPNRQYQVDVLYLCLHYLMLDVFPSYASWRYKKVSERYLIGTKVIEIFTEIARGFKEPVSTQQSGLSLNSIRNGIFTNFLYEGGAYHTSPLLDTISEGAETADILYKINHPKEAAKVEKLTEMAFVFVKILLQYRLEQINGGTTTFAESTLERLLLERTTGNNCSDFLLRIVKHINYRHNIALQIEATNVLFLLCRTVSSWKSVPNFVQYLGNTDQVHKIIRAYLDIAKDHFQSEVLLSAIWRLMTAFLETQPSLAVLFLECGDFILPSPKSAVRLLAGQTSTPASSAATPAPTESAVRAAIDVLGHWENLLVQKPTVVSNVLRFIAAFWQTAFDHYALVERTRSDNALWDSLGKILLNPNSENDTASHLQQQELMDTDDFSIISHSDLNVRRLCCLNLSKAFVMRILSFEIHLTAGNERALGNKTTDVLDKLPAGVKNLMNKINEPTKLTQIRQAYVKNDFDPSVAQKAISSAEDLLQSIGVTDNTSVLLLKMESTGGCGDDGSAGEARQYGDSYLYDYRMAETRVRSLFKDIISKYGFTNLNNIIVTPEVQAVLDIKQYSNKFLKSILEVNYNNSLVDSQIILLRSFKTFIETSSNRVSDLIWANKSNLQGSASLYTFLMGLIKNASEEERDDGVSLTSYSVLIQFIRGLTEDWINKNAIVLTGIDTTAKKEYATKTFELLFCLCGLLNRENFAIMKSITDYTAIRFHRPLLESVMLCLRTLGPVVRNLSTAEKDFQNCLEKLLTVVCQSFHVLVIKAGSYSAAESLVPEHVAESCIKDVTVVVSLLQDLISPKYRMDVISWRTCFNSNETIRSALNLFFGGVELVVNEVDRQCSANGIYSLNITPYAESALYLLLELSNIPQGANELIANNIYDCLRNNSLTTRLQEGKLDLFIRFGDGSKLGPAYVERNPLHSIWCQMLGVVNNLNRHHGGSENVFGQTVNFLQIYSPQIGKAFANANGANDSMFGLTPTESLSTPLLEEIERINMVFFGLSKYYQRHKNSIVKVENLFMAFKDCSLNLLQRYRYFFNHPVQMQAQLYPVDNVERQDAQVIPADKASDCKPTTSRFMQKVLKSIIVISHYMVTTLVILTEANVVLKERDEKWPFGNTIVYPDMQVPLTESTSFGTLVECINTGTSMLTQAQKEHQVPELASFIQGSAVLLTSQVALWVTKPEMQQEMRMEIGQETVTDIVDCLVKTETALKKLNTATNNLQTNIKLIQTLQVFLGNRYYRK